jgi:UDP-glucose 4-epimerase
MNRHIFITGASGFLGRNAARSFSSHGWTVSGMGRSAADFTPRAWGISYWKQGDVTLELLAELFSGGQRPEVVLHCAGSGSVGKSWEAPYEDFQQTANTTAAVIEAVRRYIPEALLIYPSSAAVYGQSDAVRLAEGSELHPMSPYGLHKLVAEDLCLGASRIFDQRVAIVRFFSIYGPGLRKQLLWDTSRKLASDGDTLMLDGTGKELRDFIHVEDAARLLRHLSEQPLPVKSLIVNGATGIATSVAAIAGHLIEAMGRRGVSLEFSGRCRPGDPSSLVGDTHALERVGFQAEVRVDEGIRQFAESLPGSVVQYH